MKKRNPGGLRPAQSGATFPTLKEAAKLDRRAFLVGLGAAAAATGLPGCMGEMPPEELEPDVLSGVPDVGRPGRDASRPVGPDASSGIFPPDAGAPDAFDPGPLGEAPLPDAGPAPDTGAPLAGAPVPEDAGPPGSSDAGGLPPPDAGKAGG